MLNLSKLMRELQMVEGIFKDHKGAHKVVKGSSCFFKMKKKKGNTKHGKSKDGMKRVKESICVSFVARRVVGKKKKKVPRILKKKEGAHILIVFTNSL